MMKQTRCFFVRPVTFVMAITVALFSLFAILAQPVSAASKTGGKVIIYNWSEYIPQKTLNDFTKETGIEVVYSTFESNEAMYAKVKLMRGRGYDVIVPSNYFIAMMHDDGLLQNIDKSKIDNLKHIDASRLGLNFDPANDYSVPYMWGATGIAYNTKYIPEGSITKWADLLDPKLKGKLILTDDLRDGFGLALKVNGHSVNSTDEAAIKQAYDFLLRLKASVRIFDVTAAKQALITEEAWAGPIWNGDYLVAKEENEHLAFIFPTEGAVLWMDNFVIPKAAENVENAHIFINYMLRPEVAKQCIEAYQYSSPNKTAVALLAEDLRTNVILVPTEKELKNSEFPDRLSNAIIGIYQKYWEQLKTTR